MMEFSIYKDRSMNEITIENKNLRNKIEILQKQILVCNLNK